MNKKLIIAPAVLIIFLLMAITPPSEQNINFLWAAKKTKEKVKEKDSSFSLNFNDVEISEFLNVMSQVLGKNIILSDKVKGKITINSAQKVPLNEAYDLMKSILEIKGFAVIETDNLIKVVPVKEAVQKNVEVILDGDKIKLNNNDDAVTFLMEMVHADANDVANVLKTLKSPDTDVVVYKTLNILIFSGNSTDIKGLVKIAQSLDKNPAAEGETDINAGKENELIHVVNLENADAVSLSEVLSRIPFSQNAVINTNPVRTQVAEGKDKATAGTGQGTQTQTLPAKLSIIANKETNSLIINASGEDYKEILKIIKQLDVIRPQILIEAMIVEVDVESNWGLGIDWTLGGQQGTNLVGGSSIMGGIPSYSLPTGITDKTMSVPLKASTMTLGYMSDTSVLGFVLLNATGQDKNINILSTPHILTIDNHEAEFNVGEEIAVPTNSRLDTNNNIYYTFEYKPVGLKLKLTPHITTGEKITLELFVEVNSVLGTTTTTSTSTIIPPDLAKRDIKTKVSIKDGSTIVVGGLMRNENSETETKVPLLGDIPLLGWFFKYKTKESSKTNLLVFITPRVVTDPEKIKKITEEKQQEFRKIQEESKK
ncbi:MAG TPA: secretin N-terminal domain-containing protein [Spirochaetota bacterium]|nr:secretin N-terminal domain-containing protein [Spirochaetota bacterium]